LFAFHQRVVPFENAKLRHCAPLTLPCIAIAELLSSGLSSTNSRFLALRFRFRKRKPCIETNALRAVESADGYTKDIAFPHAQEQPARRHVLSRNKPEQIVLRVGLYQQQLLQAGKKQARNMIAAAAAAAVVSVA
jgi:hypothetical protein